MVTQLNPDALEIAAALDTERLNDIVRSLFHGIPTLIKNNIPTNDSMDNTWANFRCHNTSNGWSALGGPNEAAYYPGQGLSGSSSGSGVASSFGLALASLGTETDSSIISPSDVNNLVGIKPSVGLTSHDLMIPISERQDTIGPMARMVKDAAYLLSVIAGPSQYDNYTDDIPFDSIPDYVAACKLSVLSGMGIGIPRNVIDIPTNLSYYPIVSAFNAALSILEGAGAIIVDNANWTSGKIEARSNGSLIVLEADFVSDLPKSYLSQLILNPQKVTSLADVLNFTQNFTLQDWPERDTHLWDESVEALAGGNTTPEFWSNYTQNLEYAGPEGFTSALENYTLDAMILPTAFASRYPAILGFPIVTVPTGKISRQYYGQTQQFWLFKCYSTECALWVELSRSKNGVKSY